MEKLIQLYLEKAENELVLAESLFKISGDSLIKEKLEVDLRETFYSAVITHSYYCIFYCAKAVLLLKGIKTKAPNEHKKTYNEFKKLIGFIDGVLFEIYESESLKAGVLLKIFFDEKKKRGEFTYKTLPQANIQPAKESLENAGKFFKNINNLIKNYGK